jgi:hypothetical protein
VKGLALAARFVLEVWALAGLAYSGWRVDGPLWIRLLLAVALPVIGIAIWGRWVAPRGRRVLRDPVRLIPEWVVFGGATVALVLAGQPVIGVLLAVLAAADRVALWLLGVGTGGEAVRH